MSEGKRPGGLTALAVINFIFGGLGAIGALGWVAMKALHDKIKETDDEAARKVAEAFEQMSPAVFYGILALLAGTAVLQIASGVGYLQQKKFLGRVLGNVCAIVKIGSTLVSAAMMPADASGGFSMQSIVDLVYPALTLWLLNQTFKEDFVNP